MMQLFLTLALVPVLLWPATASAQWHSFSGTAMTTPIELEFWHRDGDQARRISAMVLREFDRIDLRMTRYSEDSELSAVNRNAADGPVAVSAGLYRVLERARQVSQLSGGAFDISFGSVGYLYDYRHRRQPSDEALARELPRIDYRDILLDAPSRTVHFRKSGLRLDLGGIAKGYAVDRGIAILRQQGVNHALLSAGGDMRLLGDRRGRPWMVGVRDPRSDDRNAVVLPLADVAMSTSGDYERFFIADDGERVHHILSPRTGRPAKGIQSVTIMGPDSLTTDGLSTAVFVLGVEQGLAMINRLAEVDAIIIDSDRRMHYSSGLMPPE